MKCLKPLLNTSQDRNARLLIGSFHKYLLKASFKCLVTLYELCILIKCRCSNNLYLTSCQLRFEDIGRIHCSAMAPRTNQKVYFIYKQHNGRITLGIHDDLLEPVLKFS